MVPGWVTRPKSAKFADAKARLIGNRDRLFAFFAETFTC
jgi:hypothetical protein